MTTRREHKQGALGRRLMWGLLAVIAVCVMGVLYAYGIHEPAKGPGNVPVGGESAPLPEGGLPPPAK
jgi:hypothetical protein